MDEISINDYGMSLRKNTSRIVNGELAVVRKVAYTNEIHTNANVVSSFKQLRSHEASFNNLVLESTPW